MPESLPPRTANIPHRWQLTAKARALIYRDKAIERLALAIALKAYEIAKEEGDGGAEHLVLQIQAEAYRRAADLIEERLRMSEGNVLSRN